MTRHITLAVTGSIAAYKAADLTSQLGKLGYTVQVLMTPAATQFITPLTLQTLSKNAVYCDIMEEPIPHQINHIALAKQTDLFLVAPASANTIAQLAHGFANSIVTTCALALPRETPKLIAPAMNTQMYTNPLTQANISTLKSIGYHEIPPRSSLLACGDYGTGALANLDTICQSIQDILPLSKETLS